MRKTRVKYLIDCPQKPYVIECYSVRAVKYFLTKFPAGTIARRHRYHRFVDRYCDASCPRSAGAWYYDDCSWINLDKTEDEVSVWIASAEKKKALHLSKKKSNARAKKRLRK